jgi:hypothetical protein
VPIATLVDLEIEHVAAVVLIERRIDLADLAGREWDTHRTQESGENSTGEQQEQQAAEKAQHTSTGALVGKPHIAGQTYDSLVQRLEYRVRAALA